MECSNGAPSFPLSLSRSFCPFTVLPVQENPGEHMSVACGKGMNHERERWKGNHLRGLRKVLRARGSHDCPAAAYLSSNSSERSSTGSSKSRESSRSRAGSRDGPSSVLLFIWFSPILESSSWPLKLAPVNVPGAVRTVHSLAGT